MVNYQNGKIYKITSFFTDIIYIGSTCNPLYKRHHQHKYDYKSYNNGNYHYTTSFDIIKHGDSDIQLIELFPCNSKEELHAREAFYIKQLDCVNKVVPLRTDKQYYEDNKEKILEQHKQTRSVKNICICGGSYSCEHKSRHLKSLKHITFNQP